MWRFILIVGLFAGQVLGQPLPEGFGLAKEHAGDRGIGRDPAVLFAEDFETGDVKAIAKRWGEMSNKGGDAVSLADDSAPGSGGKRAIQMTATLNHNTGGHLYTTFDGVDQMFARFYVKFPEDAGYVHHFVHLGGYRPATRWPQGGAGERPRGDERVTAGIEPFGRNGKVDAPGDWNFYAYWHEMKKSADGKYWGNSIWPVQQQAAPRGRWQCVEVMMKLNTPGQRDGRMALWLDGKLVMDVHQGVKRGRWTGMGFDLLGDAAGGGEAFEGFDFRTDERLKLNFFWLLYYVTDRAVQRHHEPAGRRHVVWFDNVVVARRYVGPIYGR